LVAALQIPYSLDNIESVQRFFIRKLSGLSKLSYFCRLKILDLETLERRGLINDLVLYYKIQICQCDMILNVAPGFSVIRGNNFNMLNKRAALVLENIGSRLSGHYFRSVCWFVCLSVCLFVCAEFFSAVFEPISIKLGHMLYVWV